MNDIPVPENEASQPMFIAPDYSPSLASDEAPTFISSPTTTASPQDPDVVEEPGDGDSGDSDPGVVEGGARVQLLHLPDDGEPLTISNLTGKLPVVSRGADRSKVVTALTQNEDYRATPNSGHAIARAVTDPDRLRLILHHDLTTRSVTETATLLIASVVVWLTHLLPLLQPRVAAAASEERAPIIDGDLDEDGKALGLLRFTFEDLAHLRRYLINVITMTLKAGGDYGTSILVKGVVQPGLTFPACIQIGDDPNEVFYTVGLADGITRFSRSWEELLPVLNPTVNWVKADAATKATAIVDALLTMGRGRELNVRYANGKDQVRQTLLAKHLVGVTDTGHTESAIRVEHTLVQPTNLVLAVSPLGGSTLKPKRVMSEGLGAAVAGIHTEQKPWEVEASTHETVTRALRLAGDADDLDPDVVSVALGAMQVPAQAPQGDLNLMRAVWLVSHLLSGDGRWYLRKHLRIVMSRTRIMRLHSYLASVIDVPWRKEKATSLKQARRAWSNGSPVPKGLAEKEWMPVVADSYKDLVERAWGGDHNAKMTVVVAGGIALVTDQLLTANTGSKEESDKVPFRANVDTVVEGLASRREGLYLLAHVADQFESDRAAYNSYTEAERVANRDLRDQTYLITALSEDDPAQTEGDQHRQQTDLVELTEYIVVSWSDPDRARAAEEKRGKKRERERDGRRPIKPTPEQSAAALRYDVRSLITRLDNTVAQLISLGVANTLLTDLLGDADDLTALRGQVGQIGGRLYDPILAKHSGNLAPGDPDDHDDHDDVPDAESDLDSDGGL